ncbi:MAG: hypothetical protein H7A25_18005 [Leptospiraceae bacterium]|nr:hypothetical protein [Leptospiraceae bacterium]MCP5501803.1 hypothetical protein [Leptospiraceae bacterium]
MKKVFGIIVSLALFVNCNHYHGRKDKDKEEKEKLVLAAAVIVANTPPSSVCGKPNTSSELFIAQMIQTAGPSTGNSPWQAAVCRPLQSVTTATSFIEEQSFANEALLAMATFAYETLAGLSSTELKSDEKGLGFGVVPSTTHNNTSTTVVSQWSYDTAGRWEKKTRTASKVILGGTSYSPYVSNSGQSNPVTGCPSNPTSNSSPTIVDVVETTTYDYSTANKVIENFTFTCNGTQAQGPGYVQKKEYTYSNGLLTDIKIYVNSDISVTFNADGSRDYSKLFSNTLSANPVVTVNFAYSGDTITATTSGYYVQSTQSSASLPYTRTLSITDKVIGSRVYTLNTSAGKLTKASSVLSCNAQGSTSDSNTVLYPKLFQTRGYCKSIGDTITSTTSYSQASADNDKQTWDYTLNFNSRNPYQLLNMIETNTLKTTTNSVTWDNKLKTSYYWVYDDAGRIIQDSYYIYHYDSLGLQSYSKTNSNTLIEVYSR